MFPHMSSMAGVQGAIRSASVQARLRIQNSGLTIGRDCRFNGMPIVTISHKTAKVVLGDRVVLTSRSRDTALGVNHPVILRTMHPDASICIGDDTGISGGSICSFYSVAIGQGCLIGANVVISDTDFHPVDEFNRRYLSPIPPGEGDEVQIGDDVFIGTGATILRGTKVGDHAVIGAASVVKGTVAEGHIVGGNPARVLRSARALAATED